MNSKLPTGFKILHVYLCVLGHVQLFAAPWTVAFQDPVHGIFQARILKWGAIYYSRGSFPPQCSMTYPSSPLQSYPLLSAPTHYTYTLSFSLFPSRLLLHQELYTAFSLAWNILPEIFLCFSSLRWRLKCQFLNEDPVHSSSPLSCFIFLIELIATHPPNHLTGLFTYCLSLPLKHKQ